MKLGFLDLEGDLFPAVWRVAQEGHQVRYWIKDQNPLIQKTGVGMVTRAADVDEIVRWRPDVAVGYQTPVALSVCRRAGLAAWGSTTESVALESDRMYAARIARRYEVGVVPQMERFATLASARRFVEGHADQLWVVKADGGPKAETSTTHVTRSAEELLNVLDYEASRGNTTFILQERVAGVEVSTEGWFDYRRGWLQPINSTLERKHMMTGDVGPLCGCAGSIVWTWPDAAPRLWRAVLKGLTPYLEETRYVGPIDVNAIIDDARHEPHFLEFTPRLGWSAFNALMAGMADGVGDVFVALGRGEVDRIAFRHPFMASVAVAIPEAADVPLMLPYRAVRHIQPKNVWLDKQLIRSTGANVESGFTAIAEVTDAGSSISEVVGEIYGRHLPRVFVDNLAYRKDIGMQAMSDVVTLQSWGYDVFPREDVAPARVRDRLAPQPGRASKETVPMLA